MHFNSPCQDLLFLHSSDPAKRPLYHSKYGNPLVIFFHFLHQFWKKTKLFGKNIKQAGNLILFTDFSDFQIQIQIFILMHYLQKNYEAEACLMPGIE